MNLLELFTLLALRAPDLANLAGDELRQALAARIAAHPEAAQLLQPLLDGATQQLTAANIDETLKAVPHEFMDILQHHFNRRRHASGAN